ncbi:MAG: peptidoglycan DD-metalloendopeptidase family protein [Candidatus Buchananbacteria bacterium]|nr:peptidoglycan DD-metalloendopeptidase family protein [Candidatus Buchananbacteria bacterium]
MKENKKKNSTSKNILAKSLIITFVLALIFINPGPGKAEEDIGELNRSIESKRREIDAIQKQIDEYAQQIKAKKQEARGLQNQIAILDNQIAKVNLDVEATQKLIEQTNLEIQATNIQIQELEVKIDKQKEKIVEYLRLIYKADQVSYFEILLVNNSFSDFFDQIKYSEQINTDLKESLDELKTDKTDFETQKLNLEAKVTLEEELKQKLQEQKSELEERNAAKGILLVQTNLTQRQYQNQQYQLQLEQQQINSDILGLEKTVRKKLEDQAAEEKFKNFGPARLAWPVDPSRGISAYFHDPDYPFRYIFEHPAIDVRASQGTAIKAPEAGYVARVKFAGDTSYAYVMLIHNDGLSTVFGHISKPLVKEDEYVSKGQVIALSGGMPGGIGSGNLSTGAHLHFEVRLDGIPVNPLEYLP